MIQIKSNHHNYYAKLRVMRAMEGAFNELISTCEPLKDYDSYLPGFSEPCNYCAAKQGCRDVTRAYYHIKGEVE